MSPEPRRPTKRSRKESPIEEIRQHPEVYYANGDIVLLSLPGEDGVITAFKVDKVFLSRQSPVFETMFSLPPPENVEKFGDAPLVRLQDPAEYLASFIRALYGYTVIPFGTLSDPETVGRVEGVLRLSEKYQVDKLRDNVVAILSADWPSSLVSWDTKETEIKNTMRKYHDEALTNPSSSTVNDLLPEPCATIRLAREHGIDKILPAAFYHLSRIPPLAEYSKDPSLLNNTPEYRTYINNDGRTARFSLLSTQDFVCLLRGIRAMPATVRELARDAQRLTTEFCIAETPEGRKACVAVLEKFIDDLDRKSSGVNDYHSYDPVHDFLCWDFEAGEACDACAEEFPAMMLIIRDDLWDKLPALFGLPEIRD